MISCAIWYYLYNLKNVKNAYGGVLILVKLQAQMVPNRATSSKEVSHNIVHLIALGNNKNILLHVKNCLLFQWIIFKIFEGWKKSVIYFEKMYYRKSLVSVLSGTIVVPPWIENLQQSIKAKKLVSHVNTAQV